MNETLNSIGMAGLGALLATTIFLAILVTFSARFFRWLKSAGFRFQDFEAHQDRGGVKLTSAFKRDGFEPLQRGYTQPSAPALPDVATFARLGQAQAQEKPYTIMVGIAAERLRTGDRIAVTDRKGYLRLATALETELGTADNDADEDQQIRVRVPKGSLLAESSN
jgi:hypothetical protein